MLLRMVIGYHFFKEGTDKLKSGDFSSAPVLASARGPFAPMFKRMVDDLDGKQLLCIKEITDVDGRVTFTIDPERTISIWDDFVDQARDQFEFGSPEIEAVIVERRETLAAAIRKARSDNDTLVNTLELEVQRAADERDIHQIRAQYVQSKDMLDDHVVMLNDWIVANRIELIAHFSTADRIDGFKRDGANRQESATYVDSIRGQVDTIRIDRQKQRSEWSDEVIAMWDSLEQNVNGLAVDDQRNGLSIEIHRPFDQPNTFAKTVDAVIPWFDTIVGALLILGLFTRLASLASALFLVSVILTQPPWIPGTIPTYFHFIETLALLLIFAIGAGRMGGLDYFISLRKCRTVQPETERQS